MYIFHAAAGFVMILAGRQFYPSFVAGVGYAAIFWLIQQLDLIESQLNIMWVSLIIALAFGVLTFELKRWLAGITAFIAGGYLLFNVPPIFNMGLDLPWPLFLLAGAASVLLVVFLFDLMLVVLSAVTGATLIVLTVSFGGVDPIAMFFVLIVFGLVAQFVMLRYGESTPD
jgi:hypothetical protein